jgi:hypothetical protein
LMTRLMIVSLGRLWKMANTPWPRFRNLDSSGLFTPTWKD